MIISKQIEIDMGHRVPNHKSKCRNLHGHRYTIEAGVEGIVNTTKGSSDEGMVIDFGDLKQTMMTLIHDKYDHGFVMYEKDEFASAFEIYRDAYKQNIHFVPFIPTAENLAKHWYESIEEPLTKSNMILRYVKVWETPTSTANYYKCDLERKVE